jgi:hypothetical protein
MASVKKTALEMVQEISAKVGGADISTIEDTTTGEHRLFLAALNAANTNIITGYMWSELTKESRFTADKQVSSGWNEDVGGYDLSKIAPGFLGFVNKFMLSMTSNTVYSFATMDEYLRAKTMPTGFFKFLVRDGCLCFLEEQPAVDEKFSFYYRTDLAVRTASAGLAEYTNVFKFNKDTWVLNDQLLIRAACVEYKNSRGIDATYDLQQYNLLLNALRDANASNAILGEYPSDSANAFKITSTGDSMPRQ